MLGYHTSMEINEYFGLITDHPIPLFIRIELVTIHTEIELVGLILQQFF